MLFSIYSVSMNFFQFILSYSELVRGLQEKLQKAPNKFTSQTTTNYYTKISRNFSNDFELLNVFKKLLKIFYLA